MAAWLFDIIRSCRNSFAALHDHCCLFFNYSAILFLVLVLEIIQIQRTLMISRLRTVQSIYWTFDSAKSIAVGELKNLLLTLFWAFAVKFLFQKLSDDVYISKGIHAYFLSFWGEAYQLPPYVQISIDLFSHFESFQMDSVTNTQTVYQMPPPRLQVAS